jgi:hypothetical protein
VAVAVTAAAAATDASKAKDPGGVVVVQATASASKAKVNRRSAASPKLDKHVFVLSVGSEGVRAPGSAKVCVDCVFAQYSTTN